ncbi:hypothetical protein [Actinomadura sp. DC4]|uniref:hypothetical protein n=1 Tax=Actinomadura sp. DC4 TaxID=3055069 RepID=UPI0025B2494B|nr:hypothetical protein [Actinomadura sp. DC4]MDN3358669.1 hypothetical protein [Actinomadura sp. DC4]
MGIKLAGGVVASGLRAWSAGPEGSPQAVEEPGAAVALGPAEADEGQVRSAVAELNRLVAAGGVAAAGAGVELGPGFRSARLAGARGDQRDAVIAALRVLGLDGAGRLGDRAGFLVALFGPHVTKKVGAAAARAIGDGRWAALHLATAASDVLGPEQLEQVLDLTAPEGADLIPGGPPSALAQHLGQVLAPVPGPSRLHLILDLWAQVIEHHAGTARLERRRASQSRRDRFADLVERRTRYEDELILDPLRSRFGREPSLAEAVRWTPPDRYWHDLYTRLLQDALAATALLRTAVAVADHGLEEGLDRSEALLAAARAQLPGRDAVRSARAVPGLTGLPARPGAQVRHIHRRLKDGTRKDEKYADYVRARLANARDYGLVVVAAAGGLMEEAVEARSGMLREWAESDLRSWREGAGYGDVRPPGEWGGIPVWSAPLLGDREPLHRRLAGSAPEDVEVVGDLLWYAELIDALALVYGHDAARATPGIGAPWFDHDPPAPEPEPLAPRLDSITMAVSGAAQLVALGGAPPRGVRAWRRFTDGLLAGTAIAESLTGGFAVPSTFTALDGTVVGETGARLRVARDARTLAEWSDYMGNCIAGWHYVHEARAGRSVLIGLYGEDGTLLLNAELRPLRPAGRGWRIDEIAARFNEAPEPVLEGRFRDWVAAVPGAAADPPDPVPPEEDPPARPARRRSGSRLVEGAAPAFGTLARRAWEEQVGEETLEIFAVLAGTAPDAALVRLRRIGPDKLTDACRRALEAGTVDLDRLWAAGAVRPLTAAVEALAPAARDRFGPLLGEPPLPSTLRRLVRRPEIADVYAIDLAARRTRQAVGRLACADDPVIARAVAGRPAEPMLCTLIVMIACRAPSIDLTTVAPPRAVTVPGYPATTLEDPDGPWRRALVAARELGADVEAFWLAIAEHGLRVPASWLVPGGWAALWARAHR